MSSGRGSQFFLESAGGLEGHSVLDSSLPVLAARHGELATQSPRDAVPSDSGLWERAGSSSSPGTSPTRIELTSNMGIGGRGILAASTFFDVHGVWVRV